MTINLQFLLCTCSNGLQNGEEIFFSIQQPDGKNPNYFSVKKKKKTRKEKNPSHTHHHSKLFIVAHLGCFLMHICWTGITFEANFTVASNTEKISCNLFSGACLLHRTWQYPFTSFMPLNAHKTCHLMTIVDCVCWNWWNTKNNKDTDQNIPSVQLRQAPKFRENSYAHVQSSQSSAKKSNREQASSHGEIQLGQLESVVWFVQLQLTSMHHFGNMVL